MASIIEFLEKVGVEKLTCQVLHESMTNANMGKRGETKVTFLTREITPTDLIGEMKKTAFIVWMNSEDFNEALKTIQKAPGDKS